MKRCIVFLLLLAPVCLVSQNAKPGKSESFAIQLKQKDLPNIFTIEQVFPELTKKCSVDTYDFIFSDGTLTVTFGGSLNMLNEHITNVLSKMKAGEKFEVKVKHSSCKNIKGKIYKGIIVS